MMILRADNAFFIFVSLISMSLFLCMHFYRELIRRQATISLFSNTAFDTYDIIAEVEEAIYISFHYVTRHASLALLLSPLLPPLAIRPKALPIPPPVYRLISTKSHFRCCFECWIRGAEMTFRFRWERVIYELLYFRWHISASAAAPPFYAWRKVALYMLYRFGHYCEETL